MRHQDPADDRFERLWLDCGEGDVEQGLWSECKTAAWSGGEIVTDPLPLTGWVGLVKDAK